MRRVLVVLEADIPTAMTAHELIAVLGEDAADLIASDDDRRGAPMIYVFEEGEDDNEGAGFIRTAMRMLLP